MTSEYLHISRDGVVRFPDEEAYAAARVNGMLQKKLAAEKIKAGKRRMAKFRPLRSAAELREMYAKDLISIEEFEDEIEKTLLHEMEA